mmetsp:Transcript_33988/g.89197  ORF Transcript_33988/g.89197 Transcript_33988/m.89197 type:complete len:219 (+) Transcript_33988:1437-2093(+)
MRSRRILSSFSPASSPSSRGGVSRCTSRTGCAPNMTVWRTSRPTSRSAMRGCTAWPPGRRRRTALCSTACPIRTTSCRRRHTPRSPTHGPPATISTPPTSGPLGTRLFSTGRSESCLSRTGFTRPTTSRWAGRRWAQRPTQTGRPSWRPSRPRWSARWMGSSCLTSRESWQPAVLTAPSSSQTVRCTFRTFASPPAPPATRLRATSTRRTRPSLDLVR